MTVRGLEEVACCKHQEASLSLSLCGKGYVNSHLVAVEVSVVSCTYKGMKLDSSTLYKNRLKCLNTKSVKCWSTVEENRMALDYNFQCIPNLGLCTLNSFNEKRRAMGKMQKFIKNLLI